jgi:glycosyltransferase involved in cell wall biosynthesis
MRVMYLSAAGELGGAERSLLDFLASIRQAQPSWALRLVTAEDGPLAARAAELGVTTEEVPFDAALSRVGEFGAGLVRRGGYVQFVWSLARAALPVAAYVPRLRRTIRAFRPDLLHTNSLKMDLLGAWACPPGIAVVWHVHDYIGSRPFTARLLHWNARRCDAVVANSQSVADDARAALGGRVPVIPIHNAVDLQRFSGTGRRLDLDALAGLPPAAVDVVRIGLLGTFARWKGHTTFLDAVARLPRDLRVRAYIIGGALYQTAGSQHTLDELRRYAAALGLSDRVGFTGFVTSPDEALRALDIVVHASTAPEPFGLVIAEAMACGRAVIASEAGGAREIFTSGVDALGHTPGSADSLAARIVELVGDPGARSRLGRAARQSAERRFDRGRLAAEILPVYRRALASKLSVVSRESSQDS